MVSNDAKLPVALTHCSNISFRFPLPLPASHLFPPSPTVKFSRLNQIYRAIFIADAVSTVTFTRLLLSSFCPVAVILPLFA
jgi:hypothetical protein